MRVASATNDESTVKRASEALGTATEMRSGSIANYPAISMKWICAHALRYRTGNAACGLTTAIAKACVPKVPAAIVGPQALLRIMRELLTSKIRLIGGLPL